MRRFGILCAAALVACAVTACESEDESVLGQLPSDQNTAQAPADDQNGPGQQSSAQDAPSGERATRMAFREDIENLLPDEYRSVEMVENIVSWHREMNRPVFIGPTSEAYEKLRTADLPSFLDTSQYENQEEIRDAIDKVDQMTLVFTESSNEIAYNLTNARQKFIEAFPQLPNAEEIFEVLPLNCLARHEAHALQLEAQLINAISGTLRVFEEIKGQKRGERYRAVYVAQLETFQSLRAGLDGWRASDPCEAVAALEGARQAPPE